MWFRIERYKILHLGENTLKHNSKGAKASGNCNAKKKKDLKMMDSRH